MELIQKLLSEIHLVYFKRNQSKQEQVIRPKSTWQIWWSTIVWFPKDLLKILREFNGLTRTKSSWKSFYCLAWFITCTAWKVSKYGAFSGPYFPAFGLNMERYEVSLRIQSECEKIRTRKNSVFRHFSRSDPQKKCFFWSKPYKI